MIGHNTTGDTTHSPLLMVVEGSLAIEEPGTR